MQDSVTIASTTLEWSGSNGFELLIMWLQSTISCPNTKQWIEVLTYNVSGGAAVLSDDAGFSILVP